MLIYFEKAFHSVSWCFQYKMLDFLKMLAPNQTWIKTLNHNITANIQQSGLNSPCFPVARGCRQGNPIASYKFLLSAHNI